MTSMEIARTMDELRGQVDEAEARGWTCPDPSLSELWLTALRTWVIDPDATRAVLNRWTKLVVWFAQRFRANGLVNAVTPLVDCVQRGHDFASGAELEVPANSKTSKEAIAGIQEAYDQAGKSLWDARQALIKLGLVARKHGLTLSVPDIEAYNSQRRELAVSLSTLIGDLNGRYEAYLETMKDMHLPSAPDPLTQDLGIQLLNRIPLLPKEILPAEYQNFPAYPSLTAEEETAAGALPVILGWMLGSALVIASMSLLVWVSTDAILAVTEPKVLAMRAENELLKTSAEKKIKLVNDFVSRGVTPDKAADAADTLTPHTPEDPAGDGGGSIWGWLLGLLGIGAAGAMLANSRTR